MFKISCNVLIISILVSVGLIPPLLGVDSPIQNNNGLETKDRQPTAHPFFKSQIKELSGKLLLDAYVEITQPLQIDKKINFVSFSTPTVTPSSGHAEMWLNNTTKQFCSIFDDGSTSCLSSGGGTITGVVAGLGLVGGGTTGSVTLNLSTPIANSYIDASSVTKQGNTFNGASQLVQLNSSTQLPAVSGTLVTTLNASNVASGTLADARLSSNVDLLASTQTLTAAKIFSSSVTLNYTVLANNSAGTSGQFLKTQGNNTTPVWASVSSFQAPIISSYTTQATNATSTYADTGLSGTITPSATASRVKITAKIPWEGRSTVANAESSNQMKINLVRTSTQLLEDQLGDSFAANTTQNTNGVWFVVFIDTPSTTSAVTYKCQFARVTTATSTARVQPSGAFTTTSTMVLEEIN